MLGAMNVVKWAQENGYPAVEIRYDYEGVEKWVTGVWRAKTPLTSKQAAHMQKAGKKIQISFCKVAAHTGNHYNEEVKIVQKFPEKTKDNRRKQQKYVIHWYVPIG